MKVSEWQDGKTKPQAPGLYQRQFSVVRDTVFKEKDDERNFHYFDGTRWYVFGYSEADAMDEYERGNCDNGGKYDLAPWRGVLEEE